MSLQRRRRQAAALYQGLRSDLIQRATGDSKRNAQVERNRGGWNSEPERGTASNSIAEDEVHQGESHLFGDKHVLEAVVATARPPQSSDLPILVDHNLIAR